MHYCFGLEPDFGGKPWSLVHYVCVRSAIERLQPEQAFLYYEYEPGGPWWELTRKLLTPVKIAAPRQIFGNSLKHHAHRADIVRLEKLIAHGGIYLDADVVVHRNFDELLGHSVVLGREGVDAQFGLANAVILAEPNASFLKRWYEEYHWFRSKGRDRYWSEHSVRLPLELSKKHPDEITVLPHTAFYWPLWTQEHEEFLYGAPATPEQRGTFANHLYESVWWHEHLAHLTPGQVRKIESNFHHWARPYIAELPDDYGAASLYKQAAAWAAKHSDRIVASWREVKARLRWLKSMCST